MRKAIERENEFYLNLTLRKGIGEPDAEGNYIFEVEASNENLDLQKQVVLQRALLNSKDDFLNVGVISYDHLHKGRNAEGQATSDPSMIIGEPIEVRAEGKKTIVKGKLYHTSPKAQEIINLLKAGSTRIKASVGGIFPKIIKDAKSGVEKITSVFWNDLALTPSPVNHTVSAVRFAKSFEPEDFVKALMAGEVSTNSADYKDGRSLIPEDLGDKTVDVTKAGLKKLIHLMNIGSIDTEIDAVGYLMDQGFDEAGARTAVREIIFQGGQTTMAKSNEGQGKFTSAVQSILKSITGGKGDAKKDEDEDILDDDELEIKSDDNEENDDDDVKKSTVNVNVLLTSLSEDLAEIRKSATTKIEDLEKAVDDIGVALQGIAEAVAIIGGQPAPKQSVMGKSTTQTGGAQKSATGDRPTLQDFEAAQEAISKAYRAGRIDLHKSTRLESDLQKAMRNPNFNLRQEDYDFLVKEMKTA
ncbi:MAG: hypothetical protein FWB73_00325 [Treponema sp.]|nr:hypothetical protein [Treponema sp.]